MMNEWNENISRTICTSLLKAVSGPDVKKVMDNYAHFFNNEENWHPYGNNSNNWSIANNQQSDPLGALLEIIMNGFDAVLMQEYNKKKLEDPNYNPQNMYDVIKEAFRITEGKISNLEEKELGKLADRVVQVGIKRAKNSTKFPTYTVIDFAEGQAADKFLDSFLSINTGNKKEFFFVQGRYNQGSMGSILHCTQGKIKLGNYKLILSKRINTDQWGWTLIRVMPAGKGNRDPKVVYFAPLPDKTIASFKQDESISAFNHPEIGQIEQGTIIKLYEYAIGPGNNQKGEGLRHALTKKLITSPFPIKIHDFDRGKSESLAQPSKSRREGIYSTIFSGLKNMIASHKTRPGGGEKQQAEPSFISLGEIVEKHIGKIRVEAYPRFERPDYMSRSNQVVFYTYNGQTHAYETEGFLNKCDLGGLLGHLVVNVICDEIDKNLNLFKADRERMHRGEDSEAIREKVQQKLKDSEALKEFQKKVESMYSEQLDKDDEVSKEIWAGLSSKIFLPGEDLPGDSHPLKDPTEPPPYEGEKFPSFIKLERKKLAQNPIDVPINKPRKIVFLCDAADDYLSREQEAGEIFFYSSNMDIDCYPGELRRGHIPVTFLKGADIKVGDEIRCKFGFNDVNRYEPLVCEFILKITEEADSPQPEKIRKENKNAGAEIQNREAPQIKWLNKKDDRWNTYNFDQRTGAVVSKTEDSLTIYVNKENQYLKQSLKKSKVKGDIEAIFKHSVAVLTLTLYEEAQQTNDSDINDNSDAIYRLSSSAVAKNIIPIIQYFMNDFKKIRQRTRNAISEEETQSDLEETQNNLLDDT